MKLTGWVTSPEHRAVTGRTNTGPWLCLTLPLSHAEGGRADLSIWGQASRAAEIQDSRSPANTACIQSFQNRTRRYFFLAPSKMEESGSFFFVKWFSLLNKSRVDQAIASAKTARGDCYQSQQILKGTLMKDNHVLVLFNLRLHSLSGKCGNWRSLLL